MIDGIYVRPLDSRRAVRYAVIDGETYKATDLSNVTGYRLKYCMARMRMVQSGELPLRELLTPKTHCEHLMEQARPDGSVIRGEGIVIRGRVWLVRDIVREVGITAGSARERIRAVAQGRRAKTTVLDPPQEFRVRPRKLARVCAHVDEFTEIDRLAFCRPWR